MPPFYAIIKDPTLRAIAHKPNADVLSKHNSKQSHDRLHVIFEQGSFTDDTQYCHSIFYTISRSSITPGSVLDTPRVSIWLSDVLPKMPFGYWWELMNVYLNWLEERELRHFGDEDVSLPTGVEVSVLPGSMKEKMRLLRAVGRAVEDWEFVGAVERREEDLGLVIV